MKGPSLTRVVSLYLQRKVAKDFAPLSLIDPVRSKEDKELNTWRLPSVDPSAASHSSLPGDEDDDELFPGQQKQWNR